MAFNQDLTTRFRADTSNFDRGTRRIQDGMRRLERTTNTRMAAIETRLARAGRVMNNAFAGLAAVAALKTLGTAVQGAIDRLDDIAKSADKIGITTDALQELRVAADLSGVSADNLDTALSRFARTASDARFGLSTAVRAFQTVGVTVTDTTGNLKPLDQLLGEVSDGMAKMSDDTRRAAVAQELFGRSGAPMVNLLKDGSAAIDDLRKQARDLGIVIDESLIRRSVKAKDELTLLNDVLSADLTVSLVQAAPLLKTFTGLLVELANAARFGAQGLSLMAGTGIENIGAPKIAVLALANQLDAAKKELADFDATFKTNMANFGKDLSGDQFNAVLKRQADRRAEIVAKIEDLQKRLSKAESGTAVDVVPQAPKVTTDPALATLGKTSGTAAPKSTAAVQLLEQQQERVRQLEQEQQLVGKTAAQTAQLNAQFQREETLRKLLNAAAEKGATITPDELEQAKQLADQTYNLTLSIDSETRALNAKKQAAEEASRAISEISDAITGAIQNADSFTKALENVALALANIAIKEATKPGGGFLGQLLGGFGSFFGGGGSTAITPLGGTPATAFHSGGLVGRDGTPRMAPPWVFDGAPRYHSGGIAGLRPNEVPAILQRGEIIVPKNIGNARRSTSVTVQGSTIVLQGSNATPEELRRILDERDKRLVHKIITMNERDPTVFHT